MSDEKRNEKLKVIYVEPGKCAQTIEIDDDLKASLLLWLLPGPFFISRELGG